jgi:hypothetical protein
MSAFPTLPEVSPFFEFCGVRFRKSPEWIARDEYIAQRVPEQVAHMETQDVDLRKAFGGVVLDSADLMAAYRAGDDAALGRLVKALVRKELTDEAEWLVEDEAEERFGVAK